MRAWWTIRQDQEKSLPFEWYDPATGLLYNFSTGHTFTFQLVSDGRHYLNKTSGIVGDDVSPNVVVGFLAGELADVPPGIYLAYLIARNTAQDTDDIFEEYDPPIVEVTLTPVAAP